MDSDLLLKQLHGQDFKLGDLKKIAKEIKTDHLLALELWRDASHQARLLAVLILDKSELDQDLVDRLVDDLDAQDEGERLQISEWLLANQLMKSKKTAALVQGWEDAEHPLLRRLFWYHQGRMRWLGKIPNDNGEALLSSLEANMATSEPEVQWAMNFAASQIGVFDPQYRARCIALGERIELYKDDPVARGCAPEYLPDYIEHQLAKLRS